MAICFLFLFWFPKNDPLFLSHPPLQRSSITLFLEQRFSVFFKHAKWYRVGTPATTLGLKNEQHYLLVAESSDWVTDNTKRLRQIFRRAIIRVCLVFLRRRRDVARILQTKVRFDLPKKPKGKIILTAIELRNIDILAQRMKLFAALIQSKDASQPNVKAEALVEEYENVRLCFPLLLYVLARFSLPSLP